MGGAEVTGTKAAPAESEGTARKPPKPPVHRVARTARGQDHHNTIELVGEKSFSV